MKPFVNAKPVWINEFDTPNLYADFVDVFMCKGTNAKIRIAADSHYALYVNDKYVYASQYPDDMLERVYDELDISEYVNIGENRLHVVGYCTLTDSSVYKQGKPYVIYEVYEGESSVAASGTNTLARKNPFYKSGEVDLITVQLGYTFSYDSTKPEGEYVKAILTGDDYCFIPRPVKACEMKERETTKLVSQGVFVSPEKADVIGQRLQYSYMAYRERIDMGETSVYAPDFPNTAGSEFAISGGDGMYFIFDIGHNEVGLLDVEFTVDDACSVLIGWGEHLDDLRVRAHVGHRNFVSEYIAKPGKNHFFHPLRRIGARYLQIHICANRAIINYAGVRPIVYPLSNAPVMELGDALNQKIYDVCLRTLEMCMHEHYEDCPWREQALYAMDSRNQMLAGYYAFGEYEFAKASLRLLARTMREDGLLELCAPAKVVVDIPSFSMMYVVALWEYLLYSGDEAFVREYLPIARRITYTALEKVTEEGLVPRYMGQGMWNFYEWTDNLDDHHPDGTEKTGNRYDAPLSAFLILCVTRFSWILKHFGETEEAERLNACAEMMRKAAHKAFYDHENAQYYSYAYGDHRWAKDELTQALAVYAGICPEDQEMRALSRLTDGSMTPVTLAYSIFKFEALLKHPEAFGNWVRRDIESQWGSMLMSGGTSFYETMLGCNDFDRGGSLCHGWSAVPAYLYFAYGVGETPKSVGWKESCVKKAEGMPEIRRAVVQKSDGTLVKLV